MCFQIKKNTELNSKFRLLPCCLEKPKRKGGWYGVIPWKGKRRDGLVGSTILQLGSVWGMGRGQHGDQRRVGRWG